MLQQRAGGFVESGEAWLPVPQTETGQQAPEERVWEVLELEVV